MNVESPELKNYEQNCKEIIVQNHEDEMKLICKKYLRFLDTSKAWSPLFSVYDVSLLINYWLYDKITHIYGTTQNDVIGIAFTALQRVWDLFPYRPNYDPYYHKCKPEPKIVNHEDWENRKKLYDYYVDYGYLFSMAQNYHANCDYYKKIKEMSSVYKSYEVKCPTEGHDCPKFFHKFHKENHEHILENLPCRERIEREIAAATAARAKASSSHHPGGSEPGHEASKGGPGQAGSEFSTPVTQITSQTSDIGTKLSHSVLGAAPVVLTATMLYRHTPLGPWIRRFRGGSTNTMNAMETFSPYTTQTGDMFSDASANYISYQPM
ncbi:hypothetical protein PVMG_05980 [Plasmodium vivax Mauritania I]|uniref:Variable surface protein Vir4 n=1 Tax=Plasmodium vivax Mauritania I TaxID=1035515 RepID=A0A0J9W434_PLAVI|nr:hypothetical protein PVMG_05980 [Plasmodium vivax Mauritania I]